MEQIQHQNLNHPAASNYLANCQPKNLSFDFIATGSNGFYDLTSFGRSCNQKSSNSLRQQPLWYPKRGDNIVVFINYQSTNSYVNPLKLRIELWQR